MKKPAVKAKKESIKVNEPEENAFPIVAIGASAGGLEAITQLLHNLSPTTGMAYIYAQHLSPDHKSTLASILAKVTSMRVQEVKNNVLIAPNNLYIIPPNKGLIVSDGHIKLIQRPKATMTQIDSFFQSLGEKHKERAIGVILSGSANDGTQGLLAIKSFGGLTFAQDDSAKFNSMPHSAIAAGAVDFILPAREIGLELTRLGAREYMRYKLLNKGKEIENGNSELQTILTHLHKETTVDFSQYKMTTIKRRIFRRLLLNKMKSLKEYLAYLDTTPAEINILFQDLLINVTSFFRDSEVHQFLKKVIFPKIVKDKPDGEGIRIWVPACATGEEVYSIAMIMLELKTSNTFNHQIQIFATDLSKQAILKARIGEYSSDQVKSVSPQRLLRFYKKNGNSYQVTKELREMCIFATHNVLTDPPFSRMDFVSCCNLLIYLDTSAQHNIINIFHYALRPKGFLMLGKAESVGRSTELFSRVNRNYKIYARKERDVKKGFSPVRLTSGAKIGKAIDVKKNEIPADKNFNSIIDDVLLAYCIPASVVINYSMEILQFRGATDLFLKHSSGRASLNILKMILPEIAFELRYAITEVIKKNKVVRKTDIEINVDAKTSRLINLEVIPIPAEWPEPLLLVLFRETGLKEKSVLATNTKAKRTQAKDALIAKLKEELLAARSDMQLYIREQDSFTEELQNANEEVVSSNEELQSINEELETSKEEIASTNEELITTNQELETRNELLNESYDYSDAIINTMHEPMLILDKELRVKSANQAFYKNFKTRKEDTENILLFELGNGQWDIPRLYELLINIIPKNSHFHDFEVKHSFSSIGQKTMLLNASRIVLKGHGNQLILLAINDITEYTEYALSQTKEKELLKKDAVESKNYTLKLEHAVEERTKELEHVNRMLAQKNSELEKINSELESFAYISSHDLQEPLRKIQTFASRILETESQNLSDKGKDYFNRMQNASIRMKKLIEDLLAFSHLSIDERIFESTDLAKIVTEVKIELREVIEEKKATVETINLGHVNIIPFQFRQLMYNLINNSLKFARPNSLPHIVIKGEMVEGNKLDHQLFSPNQKYWHISIADNGIGFDPQYKDRIFEVFQKLHDKQQYAGTGIGLAIVKKVVENHNGKITVSSKINKGATFNIYLPVAS